MKRTLRIVLPPVVILFGGAVFLFLYWNRPRAEARAPEVIVPLVRVQEVRSEDVRVTVPSQGTVAARTDTTLVPQVAGRVIEVSPKLAAGGFFEPGDLLLALDPADHERAVVRARARVAQAELRLAREEAEAELARSEWRDLREGEEEPSPLTSRALHVAEARADLEAARADLAQAEEDLARTRLTAPFAGRVRDKLVDLGQFVTRGQPVARVYSVDVVEVRLPLPDHELAYLDIPGVRRGVAAGEGPPVVLRTEFAGSVHHWNGRIVRTEGEIDPLSRMVRVVAEVPDPYGAEVPGRPPLAVGMFVQAEILGRLYEGVFRVPRSALRDGDRLVIVDDESRLRMRDVEVLRAGTDEVLVRAGLADGERILLSPLAAITDGMLIRTLPAGGSAPGETAK